VRRQSSTSSSPVDVSVNAYSQRTVALLLLCEFVLLATATYFIIPFLPPPLAQALRRLPMMETCSSAQLLDWSCAP
jgi:hypothetical protein